MNGSSVLALPLAEARRRFEREYFLRLIRRHGARLDDLVEPSGLASYASVRRKMTALGLYNPMDRKAGAR